MNDMSEQNMHSVRLLGLRALSGSFCLMYIIENGYETNGFIVNVV